MDFNSWEPEDWRRRAAVLTGNGAGCFVWLLLWLGPGWPFWAAALAGIAAGALTFWISRLLLGLLAGR